MRPDLGVVRTMATVGACMVMAACAPAKVTTTASPALEQYQIRSVVIMPFDRLTTPQIVDTLESVAGLPTTVPHRVPDKIREVVSRQLQARQDVRVIPADQASLGRHERGTPDQQGKEVIKDVIRTTGADAALLGRVLIYREREGGRWGATPAAVGFELKLVAADGVTLWTANYYERQRPLNEDFIGFWQHGGGFATAEELAEYGAERIVREFPVRKS